MSKKNSRAARTQQNIKRVSSARPLVTTEEKPEPTPTPIVFTPGEDEIASVAVTPAPPAATIPIRPATSTSGKPLPRRFANPQNTNANQQLDRIEEYRFIKSDLMLVFILTVLVIIVLVILTFVLGR
jgi:hypothetical protein